MEYAARSGARGRWSISLKSVQALGCSGFRLSNLPRGRISIFFRSEQMQRPKIAEMPLSEGERWRALSSRRKAQRELKKFADFVTPHRHTIPPDELLRLDEMEARYRAVVSMADNLLQ
jgi:hypothetical protein